MHQGFEIVNLVGTRLRREKHPDNLWFPANDFHELTELARRSATVMGRVRNKQERLRLRLRVLRGLQHTIKMRVVARPTATCTTRSGGSAFSSSV